MGSINFHTQEISLKIVYYGPGLCGKTTTLHAIHATLPPEKRSQLVSLATETERTLYFDMLPLTVGKVRDFVVRLQLYTVPGQIYYRSTRELVLRGADGIVFVADSQRQLKDNNLITLDDLRENLVLQDRSLEDVPLVFQYNKRDLVDIMSVDEMAGYLNYLGVPEFASAAAQGKGVLETLGEISKLAVKTFVQANKL